MLECRIELPWLPGRPRVEMPCVTLLAVMLQRHAAAVERYQETSLDPAVLADHEVRPHARVVGSGCEAKHHAVSSAVRGQFRQGALNLFIGPQISRKGISQPGGVKRRQQRRSLGRMAWFVLGNTVLSRKEG